MILSKCISSDAPAGKLDGRISFAGASLSQELVGIPCDDEWDEALACSRHQTPFMASAFLNAMPHKPHRLAIKAGATILAGAVVFEAEDGWCLPGPLPLTCYQGAFICDTEEMSVHARVDFELRMTGELIKGLSERFINPSLSLAPTMSDVRPFQWHNYGTDERKFTVTPRYTGIIDLWEHGTRERLKGSLMSGRQKDLQKSRYLEIAEDPDVRLLDRLHAETYERSDAEAEMLNSVAHAMLEAGKATMLVAYDKSSHAMAASVFLEDEDTAYYWLGVASEAGRKTGAATALIMEQIRRSWEKGLRFVDMVGINSPGRGGFKTSFNAEPMVYFNVALGA